MDIPHFVYLFIPCWTFGLLPLFYLVGDATISIGAQVFVSFLFSFVLDICIGVELLCYDSMLNFLRYFFHSRWTALHSYHQCLRVGFVRFLYILSNTYFLHFFIIVILVGVRWQLTVVLIYISLMVNDVEHLLMCLLGICLFSFEKCLIRSFAPLLNAPAFREVLSLQWNWVKSIENSHIPPHSMYNLPHNQHPTPERRYMY